MTDYYWVGTDGTNPTHWNVNGNWATGSSSGSAAGDHPRTNNDKAIFDTGSNNCSMNIAGGTATVGEISITGGYSGTITQAYHITVDDAGSENGEFAIAAGTWDTNSTNFVCDAELTITGGNFNAGNSTSHSCRKLSHAGGTLTSSNATITCTGSGYGNTTRTVDFGDGTTISGNLDLVLTGAGNNRKEDWKASNGTLRHITVNNAAAVIKTGRTTEQSGSLYIQAGKVIINDGDNHTCDFAYGGGTLQVGGGCVFTTSGNDLRVDNIVCSHSSGISSFVVAEQVGGTWDGTNVTGSGITTITASNLHSTINVTNYSDLTSDNTKEAMNMKITFKESVQANNKVHGPLQGNVIFLKTGSATDCYLQEDLTINGRLMLDDGIKFHTQDASSVSHTVWIDAATWHTDLGTPTTGFDSGSSNF